MQKHSCLVMDKKIVLMSVSEDEQGGLVQSVCISKKRQKYAVFSVNFCAMCGEKAATSAASIVGYAPNADKAS